MGMICEVYSVPSDVVQKLRVDSSEIFSLLESLAASGASVSLEKSWHGIHFVLTGSVWEGEPPLNFLVSGGEPLNDEDMGYGPARIVEPTDVATLNATLAAFSDEDFKTRFDPAAMNEQEIYPQIWDEPIEELRAEYSGYLNDLKALINKAAETGDSLLIVVS